MKDIHHQPIAHYESTSHLTLYLDLIGFRPPDVIYTFLSTANANIAKKREIMEAKIQGKVEIEEEGKYN